MENVKTSDSTQNNCKNDLLVWFAVNFCRVQFIAFILFSVVVYIYLWIDLFTNFSFHFLVFHELVVCFGWIMCQFWLWRGFQSFQKGFLSISNWYIFFFFMFTSLFWFIHGWFYIPKLPTNRCKVGLPSYQFSLGISSTPQKRKEKKKQQKKKEYISLLSL